MGHGIAEVLVPFSALMALGSRIEWRTAPEDINRETDVVAHGDEEGGPLVAALRRGRISAVLAGRETQVCAADSVSSPPRTTIALAAIQNLVSSVLLPLTRADSTVSEQSGRRSPEAGK